MMRSGISLLLILVSGLVQAQEKKESKGTPPIEEIKLDRKDPVIYEKDIEPIFAEKCQYCHAGNVTEGKFDMGSYDKVLKGGKRGAAITAGDPNKSWLYLFSSRKEKPIMPPKSEEPLTPQELALIKLWIEQGAKPPTTTVKVKTTIAVSLPPALVKPVRGVSIKPDNSAVAASRGNQIHLYNTKDGTHVKSLIDPTITTHDKKPANVAHVSLVESMAFSPDGKTLATGSFQELKLWDMEKGELKQTLTGFADRVVAMAFSADGKHLATGGGAPTEDGEVKLFESSGQWIMDIKPAHSDTCFGLAFSPDGSKLATCGADKFVKVFEVPSGKFLKAFEGHTHHVLGVAWKSDGKLLASGGADNVVKIWDFEKGEQTRTINAHQKQITGLVAVGKMNTFLTSSGDQTVKLWNIDNGGNTRTFTGSADFVYAISASPDGKLIATGGEEGIVRLYNGENGQLIKPLLPPDTTPKKSDK